MPTYSAGEASISIAPDLSKFVDRLKTELRSIQATFGVEINPDLSGFTEALRTRLRDVHAALGVRVTPDMSGFSEDLRTRLQATNAQVGVQVNAHFDAVALQAELDRHNFTIRATVQPHVDQAELARIDALLDHLARTRTANINPSTGLGQISRDANTATNSLNAMSAVKFTALIAGIAAIAPALLGAVGAAGGLVAILGGLGVAGAVGGSGIIGAFSAMKDATESASAAAKTHSADLDHVTDAQIRLTDAQHNEMQALQRVTAARKDAKDAIDDLNLSVKNGVLSERGAELSYRRAVQRLAEVRARGGSNLDVEEAQLAVDQSAQNITDVRVRNQQTSRKASEANAKGVDGSDQVQSAQYAAVQASQQTAAAIRELARAQQEAAKSGAEASGQTDKLAQAMAKLSPSAAAFVTQMRALGPQWTDLRKAVQENLFSALGDSVSKLANQQLPGLKNGLGQLATSLGGGIGATLGQLSQTMTNLANNGSAQRFFEGAAATMKGLAPLVSGLFSAFTQLGGAVGPALGPFFAAIGTLAAQISGPLGAIGATFTASLGSILPTLGELINALSSGLGPVLPVLAKLLITVGQALIPLIPSLSQITQIIGNALVTAVQAVGPSLPVIGKAFADVLAAVAPLVGPLAQIVAVFASGVAQNVSALATALAPVVVAFAEGLKPVIPVLAEHFRQMTPIFAQMAQQLGGALLQALQTLLPVLPSFIQSWSQLLVALAPLLPALLQLAVQLLPVLADIMKVTAPITLILLSALTSLANGVVSVLVPALNLWRDVTSSAWTSIKGVWDGMKSGLADLKDAFTTVIDEIRKAWQGLVDLIESPFKAAGSAVSKIWGALAGKLGEAAHPAGRAAGGLIYGPGTGTSDSILGIGADGVPTARVSAGEYVSDAATTARFLPLLRALPGFADGGIVDSMSAVVRSKFPGMQLTSGLRVGDPGWHGQGKAADFSDGTDDTPGMQSLAGFIAQNYPQSLELIHSPFSQNIKNGKNVGDGLSMYGAQTMGEHRNHVHWAVSGAVSAPAAAVVPGSPVSPSTTPDYSPTGTYVGPSTVDTSKDGLPQELSAQAIGAKAGSILATGLLSAFGLESSIFSDSNPYNKAVNDIGKANVKPGAPSATPGLGALPATPEKPGSTGPSKHAYDPAGGAEQWRGTVAAVLTGTGRNLANTDRTVAQINIESGGNPNAQNNRDSNAASGTPSIGLLQVIRPTFDANKDARYPGGQTDPEANIAAALNYGDRRYGGVEKIWPTTLGYAGGGWVSGPGNGTSDSILARLSHKEFVVNAAASARNANALEAINAGAVVAGLPPLPPNFAPPSAPASPRGGSSVNFYGTQVADYHDLIDVAERKQHLAGVGPMAAMP